MRIFRARPRRPASERGFTLVELLVTMAILVIIMAGTVGALIDAHKATDAASVVTTVNGTLRTAMDLMVRDMLQVGQGLPSGRVISIPSGANATPIRMPGPPGSNFTVPAGQTELSAVVPYPGAGPVVNGRATDVATVIMVDSSFDAVQATAFPASGNNITVANPGTGHVTNGATLGQGGPADIRPGDLIMLTKGSGSTLVEATEVSGQVIHFTEGDAMNLNQANNVDGSAFSLRNATAETEVNGILPTRISKIRMISYYVDAVTDPARPRLVRRMNNGSATSFDNTLGTVVAFDVEDLRFSYDLVDGVTNPSNVRFEASDLAGTGACAPDPCYPNQIRKVNITLTARSRNPMRGTREIFRNALSTQVSLRSMAFVDRYR